MFESLRYRWPSREVKGVALAAALLTAFALFELWRTFSSGAIVQGVVVSTGATSIGRACGGTRQVASVELSDGRIVYASADLYGPLRPGTPVSLQKQLSTCAATYEVVALR